MWSKLDGLSFACTLASYVGIFVEPSHCGFISIYSIRIILAIPSDVKKFDLPSELCTMGLKHHK